MGLGGIGMLEGFRGDESRMDDGLDRVWDRYRGDK